MMTKCVRPRLNPGSRCALILAAAMPMVVPLSSGQSNAAKTVPGSDAESNAANLPRYDLAAIKPHKSGEGNMIWFTPDGMTAKNVTLRFLMKMAYSVEDDQILDAPNWVNSEAFDVEAKVDSSDAAALRGLSPGQRRIMLQQLLADRFKLTLHQDKKALPVYALVVAKNGPKLHQAKAGDTYPDGIKGPDGQPAGHAGSMMFGNGRLLGQGISIASMAPPLSQLLGRTVVDQTGLTGTYDIKLQWTPDDGASIAGLATGPQPENGPTEDSAPSIFTAIQEQLGLKLESRKAPVEVLIVDHVETPSAN